MEQNNFLLEEFAIDGSYQLRLKLKYLQEDKEKLQLSNQEMKQNTQLLREVNKQLAKSFSSVDTKESTLLIKLTQQTTHLQQSYLRTMQQNSALTCRNLMLQQIIQQAQTQHRQILRGYQMKIIELRRSIQFKESCIQSYEQSTGHNGGNVYEAGNIPPSNISMVFFNEIDQYKNRVYLLEGRVKVLETEVEAGRQKWERLEKEKELVDLLMGHRGGFEAMKERFAEEMGARLTRARSDDKASSLYCYRHEKIKALIQQGRSTTNTKPQLGSPSTNPNKKPHPQPKPTSSFCSSSTTHPHEFKQQSTHPQQTRQISSYQGAASNFKLNQLKDQLKKSANQLHKLSLAYRTQKTKRKQCQEKIKVLLNSNKFYKEKRETNADQLNYYKRVTGELLRVIEKKRGKRTFSVDKTEVQRLVDGVKRPQEIELVQNRKKYWKKVQAEVGERIVKKSKVDLEAINRRKLKKSLSDILDFTSLCHDDDKIDKYYNKLSHTPPPTSKAYLPPKNYESTNLDDFSRILQLGANGDVFDDQTLIIKPKPMSYAERKRTKIPSRSKAIDAHNLTIIRENVL